MTKSEIVEKAKDLEERTRAMAISTLDENGRSFPRADAIADVTHNQAIEEAVIEIRKKCLGCFDPEYPCLACFLATELERLKINGYI